MLIARYISCPFSLPREFTKCYIDLVLSSLSSVYLVMVNSGPTQPSWLFGCAYMYRPAVI